jgi:hypothetical protein
MGGSEDAAAGMMGVLASTAMIGVGVAGAGMVLKQMNNLGNSVSPQRRRRRARK